MEQFSTYSILSKKRDGSRITRSEIEWFLGGLLSGKISDYQMSALLMAMFINGMDAQETLDLTDVMLRSGVFLDFQDKTVIDKHSTGGVGDKTSFIIAPIAAACGVKVPMVAGRGLGHTGGTVDKFEAIPGITTNLNLDEFKTRLMEDGLVLIGQTADIAPADKRLYALRDVTATVNSIPLISASIMSKKLAEGTSGIVMDIKAGNGAFMSTIADAKKLAKSINNICKRYDKKSICLITDMSQPLGNAIGNSLEIIECIETLKGRGPNDLTKLSLELAAAMVYLAEISSSPKKCLQLAKKALNSGKALSIFQNLIERQGGDPAVINDYKILPVASETYDILSPKNGYVVHFNTEKIGLMVIELGGGRKKITDAIDYAVGLYMKVKIGSKVKEGQPLMTIYHHHSQEKTAHLIAQNFLNEMITIKKGKPVIKPLIHHTINNR